MTDKRVYLYMNLVQVFAGLVIFLLFCTAFYLFSGQDAGMLWSIVIAIMKASVLPVAIYVLNYSVLVPRLFFSGRRLLFYLINLIIVLLSVFLAVIFMDMPHEIDIEQLKQQINDFSLFRLLAGSLILKAMLYFCMAVLPIGVRYVTKWSEDREKLEEERRRNTEAELNWLKNQLNPHFLFNTLNNISSLIQIDADKAQESVGQLSELLRYALYESNAAKVRVKDEVEFMRNYIDLMALRCSEKTKIQVRFDDFADNAMVSPLLFIPLVENAFKHGTSSHLDSLIRVDMGMDGDDVIFSCENSIVPKKTQDYSGSGVGLENLRRRLELLYPGRHSFESFTEGEIYVVVVRIKNVRSHE